MALSEKEAESKKKNGWEGSQQSAIGGHRRVAETPRASHLETNKNAGGRARAARPGSGGAARGPGERAGAGAAPEAGRRESPAPSAPRPRRAPGAEPARPPTLRSRRDAGAARRGLQVPGSPAAGAGRGLAQFPGIRRAGKRRGGRSGRRAASARAGGARAEAGPTWAGALRAGEGAGRAGGGRRRERAPRLARRLRLGPGSAGGARQAQRGVLGAPSGAARSTRTRGAAGRPERCGHCPGAGPRPRSAERGGCLGFNGCSAGQRLGVEAAAAQEGARASLPRGRPRPPRRAPWGPADPGRRGPLARRPRVPAMN